VEAFVRGLPKAELHLHIEGTLEPEMVFDLARRNGIDLRFSSVEALRAAYDFTDLQSFLDVYYEAAAVLVEAQDFHDMTWAYLRRAAADGVVRAEIFFDPQTHTDRGVPFREVLEGIDSALQLAPAELGVSTGLIMCFLRHLPAEQAMATLDAAEPHLDRLLGVGLDSSEVGFPPEPFVDVFARARSLGMRVVAHAGEEGPPDYVWKTLDLLGAERIDHGVRSMEDPALVTRLVRERTPLTVCPMSNLKLKVVDRLEDHPLKRMLDAGLVVTINSDDPAYFGGYIADNYLETARALELSKEHLAAIARNSLQAGFVDEDERAHLLARLDEYTTAHLVGAGGD
jgi:adenosine deaminase